MCRHAGAESARMTLWTWCHNVSSSSGITRANMPRETSISARRSETGKSGNGLVRAGGSSTPPDHLPLRAINRSLLLQRQLQQQYLLPASSLIQFQSEPGSGRVSSTNRKKRGAKYFASNPSGGREDRIHSSNSLQNYFTPPGAYDYRSTEVFVLHIGRLRLVLRSTILAPHIMNSLRSPISAAIAGASSPMDSSKGFSSSNSLLGEDGARYPGPASLGKRPISAEVFAFHGEWRQTQSQSDGVSFCIPRFETGPSATGMFDPSKPAAICQCFQDTGRLQYSESIGICDDGWISLNRMLKFSYAVNKASDCQRAIRAATFYLERFSAIIWSSRRLAAVCAVFILGPRRSHQGDASQETSLPLLYKCVDNGCAPYASIFVL
ncbi:hypothetical protein B0H13DRAFT_1887831 [Mycena leptocephala]|nr:hypothetical protein B0H13DRAFT_1887831 [Mycena leptocephala]